MPTSFTISLWEADAVSWIFGGIGIVLTIGRYAIRWKITRKFYADDVAHLFAVLFMVAALVCWHVIIPTVYDFYAFADGNAPENDGLFDWLERVSVIFHFLFFCSLWSVKLAFLLFYRQLFRVSAKFRVAWWVVLAFNIATFIMAIVGTLLLCDGHPSEVAVWQVCESPISSTIVRQIYIFTFVAVITSDIAVMVLPLAVLHGLQLRWVQKCSIGAIFSLSFVSVAFETLRLAKSFIGGDTLNILWLNLEMTFAVIVSALPCYYALFNWGRERYTTRNKYDGSNGGSKYGQTYDASTNRFSRRMPTNYTVSSQASDTEKCVQDHSIMQTHEVRVDVGRSDEHSLEQSRKQPLPPLPLPVKKEQWQDDYVGKNYSRL